MRRGLVHGCGQDACCAEGGLIARWEGSEQDENARGPRGQRKTPHGTTERGAIAVSRPTGPRAHGPTDPWTHGRAHGLTGPRVNRPVGPKAHKRMHGPMHGPAYKPTQTSPHSGTRKGPPTSNGPLAPASPRARKPERLWPPSAAATVHAVRCVLVWGLGACLGPTHVNRGAGRTVPGSAKKPKIWRRIGASQSSDLEENRRYRHCLVRHEPNFSDPERKPGRPLGTATSVSTASNTQRCSSESEFCEAQHRAQFRATPHRRHRSHVRPFHISRSWPSASA